MQLGIRPRLKARPSLLDLVRQRSYSASSGSAPPLAPAAEGEAVATVSNRPATARATTAPAFTGLVPATVDEAAEQPLPDSPPATPLHQSLPPQQSPSSPSPSPPLASAAAAPSPTHPQPRPQLQLQPSSPSLSSSPDSSPSSQPLETSAAPSPLPTMAPVRPFPLFCGHRQLSSPSLLRPTSQHRLCPASSTSTLTTAIESRLQGRRRGHFSW